jgi:hypothetical protein
MRAIDWSAQDASKKYRVEGGILIFLGQESLELFENRGARLHICWEDFVGIFLPSTWVTLALGCIAIFFYEMYAVNRLFCQRATWRVSGRLTFINILHDISVKMA